MNPINHYSSFSLSRASRLAWRYLNCSFLQSSSKNLFGTALAFVSSVGTALASVSSVPSTIVDRLVRPSSCLFELFNPVEDLVLELVLVLVLVLDLELVLELVLVLELELVLVLDLVLDFLKSFSTSGWFSYPGYYTDIEMPLLVVHWKSNNKNST